MKKNKITCIFKFILYYIYIYIYNVIGDRIGGRNSCRGRSFPALRVSTVCGCWLVRGRVRREQGYYGNLKERRRIDDEDSASENFPNWPNCLMNSENSLKYLAVYRMRTFRDCPISFSFGPLQNPRFCRKTQNILVLYQRRIYSTSICIVYQ